MTLINVALCDYIIIIIAVCGCVIGMLLKEWKNLPLGEHGIPNSIYLLLIAFVLFGVINHRFPSYHNESNAKPNVSTSQHNLETSPL